MTLQEQHANTMQALMGDSNKIYEQLRVIQNKCQV